MANLKLKGTPANDQLTGGVGDDEIQGDAGDDILIGGAGNDQIQGGSGKDMLQGDAGNDEIQGDSGDDTLIGGAGNDQLQGGAGNDALQGDAGNDQLDGGAGSDVLDGGTGNDRLNSGAGDDVATYVAAENAGARDDYRGEAGKDTLRLVVTEVEMLRGAVQTDMGAYRAFIAAAAGSGNGSNGNGGNSGAFHFSAFDLSAEGFEALDVRVINSPPVANNDGFQTDEDSVLAGNLLADNGSGADSDPGRDALRVTEINGVAVGAEATVELASGARLTVRGDGSFSYDPSGAAQAQALNTGESLSDSFTYTIGDGDGGFASARVTIGVAGRDDGITGTIGNDTLTGTPQADRLLGLAGDDRLDGGAGNDTLLGGDGNDTLTGGDGDDSVDAGAGDDMVIAGSGAGNDTYQGSAGKDALVYSSTTQGVTVDLAAGTASGPEVGTDVLAGFENVVGGAGNDVLRGDGAANRLEGGGGNDLLVGGAGGDTFVFGPNAGEDRASDDWETPLAISALDDWESPVALQFEGTGIASVRHLDADGDGVMDTRYELSAGGSVTALGFVDDTAPQALSTPARFAVVEDTALRLAPAQLLAGFVDREQDAMTVTDVSLVSAGSGTVSNFGGNEWEFRPAADFNGSVQAQVTVSDAFGAVSTNRMTIDVAPVNDPTLINGQARFTGWSGACQGTEDHVLLPLQGIVFSDADGGEVEVTVRVTTRDSGTLSLDALLSAGVVVVRSDPEVVVVRGSATVVSTVVGSIQFNPMANWSGDTSVECEACPPGTFAEDRASVMASTIRNIHITPIDDPTQINGVSGTFTGWSGACQGTEDHAVLPLQGIVFSDADGGEVEVTVRVTTRDSGTLSLDALLSAGVVVVRSDPEVVVVRGSATVVSTVVGSIQFNPMANWSGDTSVECEACPPGTFAEDRASVMASTIRNIHITPIDDPTQINGVSGTFTGWSGACQGTEDHAVLPLQGIVFSDADGGEVEVTVRVTTRDSGTLSLDALLSAGVVVVRSDPEVVVVRGSATVVSTVVGSIQFNPMANWSGDTSVECEACPPGTFAEDRASVMASTIRNIHITPIDDPTQINGVSGTFTGWSGACQGTEDHAVLPLQGIVFSDADGGEVEVTVRVTTRDSGTLSLDALLSAGVVVVRSDPEVVVVRGSATVVSTAVGSIQFNPMANWSGDTSVECEACPPGTFAEDRASVMASTIRTVHIAPVNDAPRIVLPSAAATVVENSQGVWCTSVRVDDQDPDDVHTVSVSDARFEIARSNSDPTVWDLQLRPGVSLDHETDPSLEVTLGVTDSGGLTVTGTVHVVVTDANDAPRIVLPSTAATVVENSQGAWCTSVRVDDQDPDDEHTVTVSDARFEISRSNTDPKVWDLKLRPGVSLDYETAKDVQVTLTATDRGGLSVTMPVGIAVLNTNDPPDARDDAYTAKQGTRLDIPFSDLLRNDFDPDVDPLTVTAAAGNPNTHGSAVFDPTAQMIHYSPDPGYVGPANFSYSVSDGHGGVDNAQVQITVEAALPPPPPPPPSLPPLFTDLPNTVNFASVVAGTYAAGTQYNGMDGGDYVILPVDLAAAAIAGFVPGTAFRGGNGNDSIIGGNGNDFINGDAGNDEIKGGAGNDNLIGGPGNDLLSGGPGADILNGGSEADRFDWDVLDATTDTVVDFTRGVGGDVLDLKDMLFAYNPSTPANFVQFLNDGPNTRVNVNADGIGGDFAAVVMLTGITGADVNTMLANGNLILS